MDKKLWEQAVDFHGHECPGLAIGFKACEAAIEKLGIGKSGDEEIVCITENDACGVDAVQSILGCSMGKGNLIYRGTGKQAFSFFNRKNGEKIRMYFKINSNNMDRDMWQKTILNLPIEEVFEFSTPQYDLPETARIFKSIVCENCKESAPEHKIRLQNGKQVCLDCFNSYDRGWK
ncbi:formylmethanofuran dehydrogenase [Romboutsia maritimum]|uniref:Formylmethanofuran dehydrogenase n=1 Tax=Romboutsia maritimum TaxID=2020948 RepID=A0A371IRP3_9FIRM|nr:FmdE family protein [Romboutsia maritimum]RDY23157.1 formylmethanofuran dehydrogenase [Romboutsia maritimum]